MTELSLVASGSFVALLPGYGALGVLALALVFPGAAGWLLWRRWISPSPPVATTFALGLLLVTLPPTLVAMLGGHLRHGWFWLGPLAAMGAGMIPRPGCHASMSLAKLLPTSVWRGKISGDWLGTVGVLVLAAVHVWLLAEALSRPLCGHPEIAIWGLRAKSLHLDQALMALPTSAHPEYPPLMPMLAAWLYRCLGGVDAWTVKCLPAVLGAGVSATLFQVCRGLGASRAVAAGLTLVLACSRAFIATSTALYAENLFLLLALNGMFLLVPAGRCSIVACGVPAGWRLPLAYLFLGGAALTKQEGMLLWALSPILWAFPGRWDQMDMSEWDSRDEAAPEGSPAGAGSCAAGRSPGGWTGWIAWGMAGIIFVLPWRLVCWCNGWGIADFAFGQIAAWEEAWASLPQQATLIIKSFRQEMFGEPMSRPGWWLVMALVVLHDPELWRDRLAWRWWSLTLMLIAGYATVYLFSVRELDWHLHTSAWRILLLPLALGLVASTVSGEDGVQARPR